MKDLVKLKKKKGGKNRGQDCLTNMDSQKANVVTKTGFLQLIQNWPKIGLESHLHHLNKTYEYHFSKALGCETL